MFHLEAVFVQQKGCRFDSLKGIDNIDGCDMLWLLKSPEQSCRAHEAGKRRSGSKGHNRGTAVRVALQAPRAGAGNSGTYLDYLGLLTLISSIFSQSLETSDGMWWTILSKCVIFIDFLRLCKFWYSSEMFRLVETAGWERHQNHVRRPPPCPSCRSSQGCWPELMNYTFGIIWCSETFRIEDSEWFRFKSLSI